jgi:hypothetical protein
MKAVKKTSEYTIFEKRSGRYAVQDDQRKFLRGDDKTRILLAEGLIKKSEPRPASEPPAEEAAAGEAGGEGEAEGGD